MRLTTQSFPYSFLRGGGEMGELTRNYDWGQSSLGTPAHWPQSLRTTLSILLNSKFPMFLFWGKELICFYNDAYRPSLGNDGKHPFALGKPAAEVWPEIWPDIKPLIDQLLAGGEASWSESQLQPFYRNGQIENVYWTSSYSPVDDESGNPAGVFVTCKETTKTVKTYQALEEHKEKLQFAIESAELATFDYNPITNEFTYNERLKDWFGLPYSSNVDMATAINSIAPTDQERVKELVARALQYDPIGKYDMEYALIHPVTGKMKIIRAQIKAQFNEQKIAHRLSGTLQDITEQVGNRKKIEESEQRFRSLVEEAPVATCLFLRRALKIEVANKPMLAIWGKGHGVIGKPLAEALPELKDQPFLQILDDIFTTGEDFSGKAALAHLIVDGIPGDYYFDYTYRPLFNDAGEVYGIMNMAVDVTEQVLSKKKIEEAEERTRQAVEAGELGTFEANLLTGEIVTSPRFDEIFGIDSTISHHDYVSVIHPEDLKIREQAFKAAYESGNLDYTARIIKKDDAIIWSRMRGKILMDETKHPLKVVGVVQDITEQIELQRQKDSFLGIASHELKTPVTSIKGFAQIMERRLKMSGDTKNAELAAKMDAQATRLSSLIADLLDVTKINHGRLQFNYTNFDFNELVEEVIEDLQRNTVKHTIQSELQFTGTVKADRDRLCQVIINLITNAIKYSPDSSRIIVYTENHGTEAQLSVQDFGIGITEGKQDRVFEQFYRVSGTKEHTFPGIGLGLYISSEIIKRMKGRIWVNSTEGKGSTFCFAIPIQ